MTTQLSRILPDIPQQYADEVAFLWLYWRNAQKSGKYQLGDLAELEERLAACIDGLLDFGDAGWSCCQENMSFEEPGELFSAAFVAIDSRVVERLDQVFEIAGSSQTLLDAIVDTFIWFPLDVVVPLLQKYLLSGSPQCFYVAISAFTNHRKNSPQLSKALSGALESEEEVLLYIRALYSGGEFGESRLKQHIEAFLEHDNEEAKFASSWSATRFGYPKGLEILKEFISHPEYHEKALHFIVMQKDTKNTAELIKGLFANKETMRIGLKALGYLGSPKTIPQIIEFMKEPELARCAGEAFTNITGIDIELNKLDAEWPDGFEAGPTENPEDEDVAMDPDEDLPWPDSEKVAAWWAKQENQDKFAGAQFYVCGKPRSKSAFEHVLRYGNQKQRAFAAHALGLYEKDKPIFNIYAPAKRQMQLLGLEF
ncbi:MAG: TIGR02270 family protein [Gammaproteobacteria bacterium]|nr:TIGR02270 family protein [Gammaproteobacteria bacterium]